MELNKRGKTYWKYLKIMLLFVLIVLIVIFSRGIVQTFRAENEYYPTSNNVDPSDSSILQSVDSKKISNVLVFRSQFRRPVTFLLFNRRYNLAWYMIDSSVTASLNSFITVEQDDKVANGHPYRVMTNSSEYLFKYRTGMIGPIPHLYLSLSGDSIDNLTRNDSSISFQLLCNTFSVRYQESKSVDLIFEAAKENYVRNLISIDLLLLKRKKALYIIFLTSVNPHDKLPYDLLGKIFSGAS